MDCADSVIIVTSSLHLFVAAFVCRLHTVDRWIPPIPLPLNFAVMLLPFRCRFRFRCCAAFVVWVRTVDRWIPVLGSHIMIARMRVAHIRCKTMVRRLLIASAIPLAQTIMRRPIYRPPIGVVRRLLIASAVPLPLKIKKYGKCGRYKFRPAGKVEPHHSGMVEPYRYGRAAKNRHTIIQYKDDQQSA
jgi:hypothetical protein